MKTRFVNVVPPIVLLASTLLCVAPVTAAVKSEKSKAAAAKAELARKPLDLPTRLRELDELQAQAGSLVVDSDRSLDDLERAEVDLILEAPTSEAAVAVRQARQQELSAWMRGRVDQVAALDRKIGESLAVAYRDADAAPDVEEGTLLVRTALEHWTVLLRQHLMKPMHTEVPGLEDDPDCAGDLIKDGMFGRYFDALFAPGTKDATEVVAAVGDLARQSACLGTLQSAQLARALAGSYRELETFLRLNGYERIEPYVAMAASQPLLLFYDVEKYRGDDSPLTRWFRDHRDELIEGVRSHRHPGWWTEVWLYDRISGRLHGKKPQVKQTDENEIVLDVFFDSIGRRENLGNGSCSFNEMADRGPGPGGYWCMGSLCGNDGKGQGAPTGGRPGAGGNTANASGRSSPVMNAPKGLEDQLRDGMCDAAGDASGGREKGGLCGLAIQGGQFAAATVRCVTQQIVRPGTKGMTCMAEATGLCSNPVQQIAKDLQQTSYAGIKLGRDCGISEGSTAKTEEEKKKAEEKKKKEEEEKKKREAEERKAQEEAAKKEAERQKEIAKVREESRKRQEELKRLQEKEQKLKEAEEEAKRAAEQNPNPTGDREWEMEAARQRAIRENREFQQELREQERAIIQELRELYQLYRQLNPASPPPPPQARCMPDDPDCTTNACSGMSDSARKTMECMKQAMDDGTARDPMRTLAGGCNPQVCDPIEPEGNGKDGRDGCFEGGNATPLDTALSRLCWAVDCARDLETYQDTAGRCGCRPAIQGGGTGGGMPNLCEQIRCAEGSPRMVKGTCTCEGDAGGGMGTVRGGKGADGLPTMGTAPTLGDVNPRWQGITRTDDENPETPGRPDIP